METKDKKPTRRKPVEPQSRRKPPEEPKKPARKVQPKRKRPVRRDTAAQEVVYTQPGPFNRNRFLLHLASVLAVVLALVLGISLFFKVDRVMVCGTEKYTPRDIQVAGGVQEGDNLIGISRAKVSSRILANLPYVKSVRIGIQLPDTINIEVEELEVVYAVQSAEGGWWYIRSDGIVLEKTDAAGAENTTKLLGFKIADPQFNQKAVAWQEPPEPTEEGETTPPVTVDNGQRLETALSILQYLEDNGMIGVASSVNVEQLYDLEFWYQDRFRVRLGDSSALAYKIECVKSVIEKEMGAYETGNLDASFTVEIKDSNGNVSKDQVIYTPFS